jgi:hypothetical protein
MLRYGDDSYIYDMYLDIRNTLQPFFVPLPVISSFTQEP